MDMQSDNSATALAVDLDGTLIATDLLYECAFKLVRSNPLFLFMLPFWLLAGKARLKHEVFSRVTPDPEALPYRAEVINAVTKAKAQGRKTVLATASCQVHAQAIADHLGVFDDVIGSTRSENLRSHVKAKRLVADYGEAGFDYLGNSADDVKVFDVARKGIAVAPDMAARKWANAHGTDILCDVRAGSPKDYLKMMRVHQWAKNTLIVVPAILDHRILESAVIMQVIAAFFAFSFLASAVYIFNDLFDLSMDRKHPTKRNRPLAAGRVAFGSALRIAFFLIGFSIILTATLPPVFALVLLGYFIATTAYSIRVKQYLLIDVLTLAGLYTVRVIAGAAATTIPPSFWLLAFSLFFFLSLALVKRYVELDQSDADAKQKLSGRGYRPEDKDIIAQAGMASGFASVVVLALYLHSPEVYALYDQPWLVWPLCPLVLYIIIRIWILARRREFNDDPVVFITTDWRSQIMIGLGALMLMIAALPAYV